MINQIEYEQNYKKLARPSKKDRKEYFRAYYSRNRERIKLKTKEYYQKYLKPKVNEYTEN